jgi:hypothetical protein
MSVSSETGCKTPLKWQYSGQMTPHHRARRQRSEQKRTFSQSFAHFLRHANGFSHAAHIFDGRSAFLTILGIAKFHM